MPFFSRKRSHSSTLSPELAPTLTEDLLDELTDNVGSLLSIHNSSYDADGDAASSDGTPQTRPNSFCSDSSGGNSHVLSFVREEEDVDSELVVAPSADAIMPHTTTTTTTTTTNPHRRGSESMFSHRSAPPRRPRPLSLTFSSSSHPLESPTSSSSSSPLSPRRRQGSLILAVDELDIKRQKRCSVPSFSGTYAGMHLLSNPRDSYGWSFGISERERGCAATRGRSDSLASPVLPFSPIASMSGRVHEST
ncbi:unnamed protein product [Tilletia controversa]|uniref:Uncharacterized protein n=1 Tax=Tilletia caries TaxID=13290 RepID=A0A177VBU7_9BASI|nr:hypothetical protein CF335_g6273 [Tilletia laevis]KAE8252437.1 hypothetical protein A4X03_0g6170 [Tilletia caries]CAD6921781.1 unnamed protein product [Tilletia controversa]CAD6884964.1 unnamed protein product [Tilletia caries]CAD6943363.1 unnamed protein product [Tilletia controversa]